MKADPAVQRTLLELADVDAELARIEHRRRTLPELAEVTERERELQRARDAVVAAETSLADLDGDIAKQEKEIDAVRAREDRDRKLLDSGLGAKQQADIEHELTTLKHRQSALEDDQLELMEQREAVAADVAHTQAAVRKAQEARTDAIGRRDAALADLDSAEARRTADRDALRGQFTDELLAEYERAGKRHGIGAALLRSRRCGACRLELDRTALADIARAPEDEVVRCQECGTILVRTAESGL